VAHATNATDSASGDSAAAQEKNTFPKKDKQLVFFQDSLSTFALQLLQV
jgi:hypothetical protein